MRTVPVTLNLILAVLSISASAIDQSRVVFSSLPAAAQSAISDRLGRDIEDYYAKPVKGGLQTMNPRQELVARFGVNSVNLRSANSNWTLALSGFGYGPSLDSVNAVAPQANLNRIEYRHGSLTEWYVNGPVGVEQGFTLDEPPGKANGQPLTITLKLAGDLAARVDRADTGLTLEDIQNHAQLRYSGLTATDADGKQLPARVDLRGATLLLRVEDKGARYPVTIDPWIQQAELTASDGAANDFFGIVSISGDTVVVGAPDAIVGPNSLQGAIYVFVKPPSGWGNMTQTAKLTASDGAVADELGKSVAISGNTVIAGAPLATVRGNPRMGAAYVFVKPANGWTNENEVAKLTHTYQQFNQYFGSSVAICGGTAVISASNSTSVFVKPPGGWASVTETADLNFGAGGLPAPVSISGDTVVVGDFLTDVGHHQAQGSARVFVRPKRGWGHIAKTADLTASDGRAGDLFGSALAISGNTIVIGSIDNPAGRNNLGPGAAYVFVKPATGWKNMTETAKLTAAGTKRGIRFGGAVALSGRNVVIGEQPFIYPKEPGAVYLYTEPPGGWKSTSKFDAQLTASDGTKKDYFGSSVAISGKTIVAGARSASVNGHRQQGAAYVFGR